MLQHACMDLMSLSTNEGKFYATVAMNLLKLYEVSYYYFSVHAVSAPPPLRAGGGTCPPCPPVSVTYVCKYTSTYLQHVDC